MNKNIEAMMLRKLALPPLPDDPVYLSEDKFSKTWLPMFVRYFAGHEGGVVSMWATNVAGNFYQEVHVVQNEKNPKEILFTVPGLLTNNQNIYSEDIISQIPFILASASKHNDVLPGSGDNYILNNLVDSAAPAQAKATEEEAWRKIYKYYGIDAPFVSDKPHTNAAEEREKLQSLIEGFDDDF